MKLELIRNFRELPFNSMKKIVKERCSVRPSYLARIRQKAFLTNIIQNHNYHQSVIFLQSSIRRKLAQNQLSDMKSQSLSPTEPIHNDTNLLGDDIRTEIPEIYRYKYDGYMFDLRELYKQSQSNQAFINPYTNLKFPSKIQNQIKRLFRKCHKKGIPLEDKEEIPKEMRVSVWFNNFYTRLGELHCYTNVEAFNNQTLGEFSIWMNNIFNKRVFQRILYKQCGGYRLYELYSKKLFNIDKEIHPKYCYQYIVNNYLRNPYLNFLSNAELSRTSTIRRDFNSNEINNDYEISVRDYHLYETRDKESIENYLEFCFNILQSVLRESDEAQTMAIIMNNAITDIDEDLEDNEMVFII